jgi:hypothetical protein
MHYIKRISLVLLSFYLLGCEKETLVVSNTETLVVQGYLYEGQVPDSIRFTLSNAYDDADSNVVFLEDLEPVLRSDDHTYLLREKGPGYYHAPDHKVMANNTYTLEVPYRGTLVTGETFIPKPVPASLSAMEVAVKKVSAGQFPGGGFNEVEPVEVRWTNTGGVYFYVSVKNVESAPEPFNDNPDRPAFGPGGFNVLSQPEVIDFYTINPRRDLTHFGTHRIVVYRVNPEYVALYENTETSSQNLSDPPSNIENGLGIFTGISTDTVYLEVIEQ